MSSFKNGSIEVLYDSVDVSALSCQVSTSSPRLSILSYPQL